MNKKRIGFFLGIAVAVIIYFLPLKGIEPAGQTCLALTLMTVVWWATQVAQSGYVGGIDLMALVIFKVAEPALVFKSAIRSYHVFDYRCIFDCRCGKGLRTGRKNRIRIY